MSIDNRGVETLEQHIAVISTANALRTSPVKTFGFQSIVTFVAIS